MSRAQRAAAALNEINNFSVEDHAGLHEVALDYLQQRPVLESRTQKERQTQMKRVPLALKRERPPGLTPQQVPTLTKYTCNKHSHNKLTINKENENTINTTIVVSDVLDHSMKAPSSPPFSPFHFHNNMQMDSK